MNLENILERIGDWIRQVIDALFGREEQPEPEPVPIPVRDPYCRR